MLAGDCYPQSMTPEQDEAVNPAKPRPAAKSKRIDSMCTCGQLATYARPLRKWIHISVAGETVEHDYPIKVSVIGRLRVWLDARQRRDLIRQFGGA